MNKSTYYLIIMIMSSLAAAFNFLFPYNALFSVNAKLTEIIFLFGFIAIGAFNFIQYKKFKKLEVKKNE